MKNQSVLADNYPTLMAWMEDVRLKKGLRPKYFVRTFGCQQNDADSEIIAGILESAGFEPVDSYAAADLIMLNTCTVRENADERFFGHLGSLKRFKADRSERLLGVAGCMVTQAAQIDRIKKSFSYVDFLLQPDQISYLLDFLERSLRQKQTYVDNVSSSAFHETMPIARQRSFRALVSIMYGCNNYCSYCIVPYTRGRERSRQLSSILREIEELSESKIPEIMLLGQNVNAWGQDFAPEVKGARNFAELLEEIAKFEEIKRIRFMTSHPKDISPELIASIGRIEKIEPHLHLPLQSGSNKILKMMNRQYSREKFLEIVKNLRAARPEIAISTDIIVGFPGEEEEDFQATLAIMEKVRFDSAFTFIYSPRRGTPAAKWYKEEGREAVKERFMRLVELQNEHSLSSNMLQLGRIVEVLCEGTSSQAKNILSGRTKDNRLVNFLPLPQAQEKIWARDEELSWPADGKSSREGEFIPVRITKAKTFSLEGEEVCL